MKIGELAARTGCQPVTIRYYEQAGLLPVPPRSEGNYRVYTRAHEERLLFIRNCRALDMSLDEIRQLLDYQDNPSGDCSEINALVEAHIEHVSSRIKVLQQLQDKLVALRQRCAGAGPSCSILQELTAGEPHVSQDSDSHVGHSH
ncbi:Cd(II)/Pb(II)-responsive transcriptional regulator [Halopseudomonas sp. Lyrl_26]|uniref:Cd(II)/Pb(II)-responsive transcriptional regulator n=1 Tax=Halopseudomonas sp. Lyrl_26 TaxID=3110923 RepID=UPI003F7FBF45